MRQPTPGVRYYCVGCGHRGANCQAQARFRANHKGYFSRLKRKPNLNDERPISDVDWSQTEAHIRRRAKRKDRLLGSELN
jgi:hypothetical protein